MIYSNVNHFFIPNRKIILAVIIGVAIVLSRGLLLTTLSMLSLSIVIKYTPVSEMSSALANFPRKTYDFALQLVSIMAVVFAGGIAGYFSKNKGWFYGILVGIISSIIYLHIYPTLLIGTSIGGWIGERLASSQKK